MGCRRAIGVYRMLQRFGMVVEGKYVRMDGWIAEERMAIV